MKLYYYHLDVSLNALTWYITEETESTDGEEAEQDAGGRDGPGG